MKRFLALLLIAGCAQFPTSDETPLDAETTVQAAAEESDDGSDDVSEDASEDAEPETRPQARPDAPQAQPVAAAPRLVATTSVSLGDVTEPGVWIKTPLVTATTPGRARSAATGQAADVTLIPINGPPTAASRASLQAMQALGLNLTDIAEVEVSTR